VRPGSCNLRWPVAHRNRSVRPWFVPDIVLGVGYWGHTPQIVLHPQQFGALAVPWLVADGYIANYQPVLNALPLILVTSTWVKDTYVRDGVSGANIEVLPVGCDTTAFVARERTDPRIGAMRERLGVADHELLILTVGGDAASKGGQEVMRALALVRLTRQLPSYPDWRCAQRARRKSHRLHRSAMRRHAGAVRPGRRSAALLLSVHAPGG